MYSASNMDSEASRVGSHHVEHVPLPQSDRSSSSVEEQGRLARVARAFGRGIKNNPGLTTTSILTLGLGIVGVLSFFYGPQESQAYMNQNVYPIAGVLVPFAIYGAGRGILHLVHRRERRRERDETPPPPPLVLEGSKDSDSSAAPAPAAPAPAAPAALPGVAPRFSKDAEWRRWTLEHLLNRPLFAPGGVGPASGQQFADTTYAAPIV